MVVMIKSVLLMKVSIQGVRARVQTQIRAMGTRFLDRAALFPVYSDHQ